MRKRCCMYKSHGLQSITSCIVLKGVSYARSLLFAAGPQVSLCFAVQLLAINNASDKRRHSISKPFACYGKEAIGHRGTTGGLFLLLEGKYTLPDFQPQTAPRLPRFRLSVPSIHSSCLCVNNCLL